MRYFLYSALVVILPVASLSAQSTQTPKPKSKNSSQQKHPADPQISPQQEQAITILKNLFEKAKELDNDHTRIRMQAQIADLHWEYNPQTARRQFTDAFRAIEQIEDEERSPSFTDSPKTRLRSVVLRSIARRDTDLAEKLIKNVPKPPTKNQQNSPTEAQEAQNQRTDLYLNLATVLAPTDPQRAAKLIPKSFNKGFRLELIGALKFLESKEPEIADGLMRRALYEIQPDPETPMSDLLAIGRYFTPDEPPDHNDSSDPIKPALIQPLLNFAFKAITIESANEQKRMSNAQKRKRMVMLDMVDQAIVDSLLPLFEKHQPERATFVRSRLGQIENAIPPSVQQAMNTPRPTTVSELLAEAQNKKETFQKDSLYAEAARKAEDAGDFDQAIEITEKLSDKRMGRNVSDIRYNASISACEKGDIDAAYRYAKLIADPFEQANALCRIALKSFEKKDLQRASELIGEAEKLVARSESGQQLITALLNIANAVTKMNPGDAFELEYKIIELINSTPSDKLHLDWMDFFQNRTIFDDSLGALSRRDFQRALRLALAINKSDISAAAQLSVCRGVLEIRDKNGETEKNP